VDVARPQHGGDELPGGAIEDQQWVIHVLAVKAVIGHLGLTAMGGIVGPVQVQYQVAGWSVPLPLLEVHADQRFGQGFARVAVDRVLQA
jgi:hypothetical protein